MKQSPFLILLLVVVLIGISVMEEEQVGLTASRLSAQATAEDGHQIFLPAIYRDASWGPTSYELIEAALEAGEIDADTALTYKVYVVFADTRLPPKYRGNDSQLFESDVMSEVLGEWETLSAATQSLLAPFLLPPYAQGSWLELQEAAASGAGASAAKSAAIQWQTFPTANGQVKVWAQTRYAGDVAKAQTIAEAIDAKIWNALVGLMGKAPTSDAGITDPNGGDDRLDIYLVHITDEGRAVPYDCTSGSSYLLLDSRGPLGSETSPGMLQITVHELMHAIQFAVEPALACSPF